MYELQLYLENCYGSHTDSIYLKQEIDESQEEVDKLITLIDNYKNNTEGYWESKINRIKHVDSKREATNLLIAILRSNTIKSIQEVATYIARRIGNIFVEDVKTATDILAVCAGELYEIIKQDGEWYIKPLVEVSKDTQDIINNRQYMLPMVCKPLDWTNNHDGGWLTKRESIIHGFNPDTHKQCLDVINILQAQEWILDTDILELEETSNKPLDSTDKLQQFNNLVKVSKEAYEVIGSKPFHFVWRYDKRGRMYSQGYQINIQASKYKKALISLSEPINITGEL